jgi:hypothetical protein
MIKRFFYNWFAPYRNWATRDYRRVKRRLAEGQAFCTRLQWFLTDWCSLYRWWARRVQLRRDRQEFERAKQFMQVPW